MIFFLIEVASNLVGCSFLAMSFFVASFALHSLFWYGGRFGRYPSGEGDSIHCQMLLPSQTKELQIERKTNVVLDHLDLVCVHFHHWHWLLWHRMGHGGRHVL